MRWAGSTACPVADIAFVAILWLMVTSRVLSPQYNVWIVGMAALVWAAGSTAMRRATIPVAITALAAQALYPFALLDIVDGGFIGIALHTVRIVALVAALVIAVRVLVRTSSARHRPSAATRAPRAWAPRARAPRHAPREPRAEPAHFGRSLPSRYLSAQHPSHVRNTMNRRPLVALLAATGLVLTACASSSDSAGEPEASPTAESCTKESLATLEPGTLTIATGEPAYEPWVKDDAPESGEGFEAAVAYAVADRLGFTEADIQWVRTTFDGAIAPGAKTFDWNLQQFTITADREKAVDFSSPYYSAPQAVISNGGSPIDGATSIEELESAKLGAAIGSTSLDAAQPSSPRRRTSRSSTTMPRRCPR